VAVQMTRKHSTPRRPHDLLRRAFGYPALFEVIKTRTRAAQIRGVRPVNREPIQLYWEIGEAAARDTAG
jgi:hypothetical protein